MRRRFQEEMHTITEFMDNRGIPDGLRQRIRVFFDYILMKQLGMLEHKILAEMPVKLREEVTSQNVQMLSKVPFFSPEIRGNLELAIAGAKYLVARVYVPETTIVYANEKQRELFIVRAGTVQIFHVKNADPLAELIQGDYFGDYELLFGTAHLVAAKTGYGFVETLVLTWDGFRSIVSFGGLRITDEEPGVVAMTDKYKETLMSWSHINNNLTAMADGPSVDDMDQSEFDVRKMLALQMAERGKQQLIIFPFDKFHLFWDPLLIIGTYYMCISVPIRIQLTYAHAVKECRSLSDERGDDDVHGFCKESSELYEGFDPFLVLDYAFDVVFLIDMYLRAVVMAFNDIQGGKDVLVIERPAIFSHYIRSLRFKVDLLASLPLSVVGFAIGYYPQLLRISHLLRMFNMSTYLKEFSDYCEEGLNLVLSAGTMAITSMTISTTVVLIWTSVIWSMIHYKGAEFSRSLYFSSSRSPPSATATSRPTT